VRRFVREYVVPRAPGWEAESRVPDELFAEMGALGPLGLSFPAEHGGGGGRAARSC
jgi:acyl-CoA dehydrogenase